MNRCRQFRALLRAFTRRFVEHELLASRGDVTEAVSNVIAILAAFGMAVSYFVMMKHIFRVQVSRAQLYVVAWTDEQFLITIAIAVAGLFVIVCWDTLFPDLTDCLVISSLPVSMATVFAAKLTAVFRVFLLLTFSANIVPLIVFSALMATGTGRPVIEFAIVHAAVISAACLFVFCATAAFQGVLTLILPYRLFRRVSAYVQFLLLVLILLMFFATPNIESEAALVSHQTAAKLIPVFWFWGLYQAALSIGLPEAWALAKISMCGLGVSMIVAILAYSAGYARYVRRTVEGSGLAPADRPRRRARLDMLAGMLLKDARERAVFQFAARTIARSRMHRLILAGYLSLGLTYVLIGVMAMVGSGGWRAVYRPNIVVAAVPMLLSFFALLGLRVLFSVPAELEANWAFRITERKQPEAEMSAIRKLMLVFGVVPAAVLSFAVYPAIWDTALAIRHAVLVTMVIFIAMQAMMYGLRKIPFTCSYLPGKRNLKVMFLIYGVLFSSIAYGVARVELWAARDPFRFVVAVASGVAALAVIAWLRRGDEWLGFIYDEKPDWEQIKMQFT